MSLTKEEYLRILESISLNYDAEYVNECHDDFCIYMRNNIKQIKNLINEHFEIIKEKEQLKKALDMACEELNEWCLSCGGIDEELHGVYPNFKTKEEWKEWCLKDDD